MRELKISTEDLQWDEDEKLQDPGLLVSIITGCRVLNELLNVQVPFCSPEQRRKVQNLETDSRVQMAASSSTVWL